MHCALKEKEFNPFYALVAKKFCGYKNSFKTTAKYILWDYLKKMENSGEEEEMSAQEITNLAKVYSFLYSGCGLSLGILSPLQFVSLSDGQRLFLETLFCTLFTSFFKTREDAKSFVSKSRHKATNDGLGLFFRVWRNDGYKIMTHNACPPGNLVEVYDAACSGFLSSKECISPT